MLYARPPVTGAIQLDPAARDRRAAVIASIGITAFDGGSEGTVFNSIAPHLQDFFHSLGFDIARALELTFLLGLA